MLAAKLACYLLAKARFRGYKPQPVTFKSVTQWLEQFGSPSHGELFTLLRYIKFVTDGETRTLLSRLNRKLLKDLKERGISPKNIIYVSIDTPASSSSLMLNMLRNDERLEGLGVEIIHASDGTKLLETSYKLEEGAIIYVDDFLGTGNQFSKARTIVAPQILGRFVEFLIAPYICEEAAEQLKKLSIEYRVEGVHLKKDRLLHPESDIAPRELKANLLRLCRRVDRRFALGYRHLGSMIVYSRNCPNTSPAVLRGNKGQDPFIGLLPRTSDLPPHPDEP